MKKKPLGIAALILVVIALIALLVVPMVLAQPASDPDITVDPTTIDFGIVVGGSQETVTITNDSDDDLIIGNIAQSDGLDYPFSIIEDNCSGSTLGQGESNTITVRIHPSTVGNWTDSFDIPSNDLDENPVTVAVSGSNRSIIQVHTDEGGNIDVDGIYENVNGAIFWNGSEFVVNDTYGHMYFWDAENGVRIGNFGIDHTTAYSGGGNNVNVHTCDIGSDETTIFNIMHNTYTYTKTFNCVDYEVEAAEFHFQYIDKITSEVVGTLAIVRSRSADINGTMPYLDVYIKNDSHITETDMTATFEAFLSDPKWYGFPAGMGFDGVMALGGSDLAPYFKGDFVTPGADYFVDINGGSEMGGMSYKLTTADFIGNGLMGTGTSYIAEFDVQYKNGFGQLQFESVLPHVYSITGEAVDSDGDGTPDICDACPNDADDDADNDGVCGDVDQCPGFDDNVDENQNGIPDGCDVTPCVDDDNDGVCNDEDQCPGSDDNIDENQNGIPDGCEAVVCADGDQDGVCDVDDNCPAVANPGQEDADDDGLGDVCDDCLDVDQDTVCDDVDNCVGTYNPDQKDSDADGLGNECDPSPYDEEECDSDGIPDSEDNCPCVNNPDQADADGDNIGDVCESTAPVPELPTVLLMGLGLAALGGFVWFRRQRQAITIA